MSLKCVNSVILVLSLVLIVASQQEEKFFYNSEFSVPQKKPIQLRRLAEDEFRPFNGEEGSSSPAPESLESIEVQVGKTSSNARSCRNFYAIESIKCKFSFASAFHFSIHLQTSGW